ncbi:MAG: hypothetical protein AAGF87_00030 [Bacteroidota bacterium]
MKNTKLVRLLERLSLDERTDFEDWFELHPRFCNSPAVKLLAQLLAAIGEANHVALSKKLIFSRTFPGHPYKGDYLRKQTHLLYQALKTWLVQKQAKSGQSSNLSFLHELQERKLDRDFQLFSNQLSNELEKSERRDVDYFFDLQTFCRERDLFFGRQQERRYDSALQEQSEALDRYFILQKLRIACEMSNRNRIIDARYHPAFLKEVLHRLSEDGVYKEEPAIAIYWSVWLTLQAEGSTDDYARLVELLASYPNVFESEELRSIYRYAQNFCIRKINAGVSDFKSHLLSLYQYQIDQRLFLVDGHFPANDFKNIITLGLRLENFEWVEQFMEQFHDSLSPDQYENVYNYGLAQYYFATKAYDRAIRLLRNVRFTDRYYDINGSIILLKTYLAQEDYESFHYFLDAYKIRLQRNREVAASYRQSIVSFLRLCKRVGRLQERQTYMSKEELDKQSAKLQAKILNTAQLFDRQWLLNALPTT